MTNNPLISLPHLPNLTQLSRASGTWLAALGIGLAIGVPMTSDAEPLDPRPRPASYRWLDPQKDQPPEWLGENVHYKKGVGLEYMRETKVGETPIEVGVGGPIVRKKKSVGLTFEVRF